MSEMFMSSGNTRDHECARCGTTVQQRENVGLYKRTVIWTTERHRAPCGAFCWGADVPPKEYRLKNLHGFPDYPCPMCGVVTPREEENDG